VNAIGISNDCNRSNSNVTILTPNNGLPKIFLAPPSVGPSSTNQSPLMQQQQQQQQLFAAVVPNFIAHHESTNEFGNSHAEYNNVNGGNGAFLFSQSTQNSPTQLSPFSFMQQRQQQLATSVQITPTCATVGATIGK
jgi:hypothetical protein